MYIYIIHIIRIQSYAVDDIVRCEKHSNNLYIELLLNHKLCKYFEIKTVFYYRSFACNVC